MAAGLTGIKAAAGGIGALCLLATVPLIGAALTDADPAGSGTSISDAVPAEYRDLVRQAGSICEGVTGPLIAAQIEAESNWNPNAGSPAGAQGIAQFMPATWAGAGKDYNGDGKADINDPADAIPSQGQYLCNQLTAVDKLIADGKATGDRIDLALAAYNAGIGAVQQYHGVPPYAETTAYIAKIKSLIPKYQGPQIPSGDVAAALEWARSIADDDSHGYVWGATGPQNYDCSGFAQAFMRRLGVELPRVADDQGKTDLGRTIATHSIDGAQPGDLLFWDKNNNYYHHVAIYAGNGYLIGAQTPSKGIVYQEVYDLDHITVRRFSR